MAFRAIPSAGSLPTWLHRPKPGTDLGLLMQLGLFHAFPEALAGSWTRNKAAVFKLVLSGVASRAGWQLNPVLPQY